jgi:hypothetical protein
MQCGARACGQLYQKAALALREWGFERVGRERQAEMAQLQWRLEAILITQLHTLAVAVTVAEGTPGKACKGIWLDAEPELPRY